MNDFDWSMVEEKEIIDYKIVCGLPTNVEKEVKTLLTMKWQPSGEMQKMKIDSVDIVVQCMVLYNDERKLC